MNLQTFFFKTKNTKNERAEERDKWVHLQDSYQELAEKPLSVYTQGIQSCLFEQTNENNFQEKSTNKSQKCIIKKDNY